MNNLFIGSYQGLIFQFKSFEVTKNNDFNTIRIITDNYIVDPLLLKLLERDMFGNLHKSSFNDYEFDKVLQITNLDTSKTQNFLNIDIAGYNLPNEKHHISLIGKIIFVPSREGELSFVQKITKHYSKS